jgi:hypothetical protein
VSDALYGLLAYLVVRDGLAYRLVRANRLRVQVGPESPAQERARLAIEAPKEGQK